jgi:hypothetical protein
LTAARHLGAELLDVVLDDLELSIGGLLLGREPVDLRLEVGQALIEGLDAVLGRPGGGELDDRQLVPEGVEVALADRVAFHGQGENESDDGGRKRERR